MAKVSIPFKRDGVSKRQDCRGVAIGKKVKFLFPSNGTAFPNDARGIQSPSRKDGYCFYSLQPGRRFQTWSSHQLNHRTLTFLFPSNGTAFPNCKIPSVCWYDCGVSIPFNRDGVSERMSLRWQPRLRLCFYSLQPGRRFQTGLLAWWQRNALVVSFYSLQTGRRFLT